MRDRFRCAELAEPFRVDWPLRGRFGYRFSGYALTVQRQDNGAGADDEARTTARAVRRAVLLRERELAAVARRRRGLGLRAPSSMPMTHLLTGLPELPTGT